MSINIFKKQVKYCFLDEEDEELRLLKQKRNKDKKVKIKREVDKTEKNLGYFELQNKYKSVSKNVMKYLQFQK
jgi:hypothetical protein